MKNAPNQLDALHARRNAARARLALIAVELDGPPIYDETAHHTAIAAARVAALTGDQDALPAALAARDAAQAKLEANASERATLREERKELEFLLDALDEAIETAESALKARRRAFARERFDTLAADYHGHVAAAHALLPGLVAAGEGAFSGSALRTVTAATFAVPDFTGISVDPDDHRVFHVPLLTAPDLSAGTADFQKLMDAVA